MKYRISTIVVLCSLASAGHAGMYTPSQSEVMGAIKTGAFLGAKFRMPEFSVTQIKTRQVSVRRTLAKNAPSRRIQTTRATRAGARSAAPYDRYEQSDPNWLPSAMSGAPEWVPLFDFVEASTQPQTRHVPAVPTPIPTKNSQSNPPASNPPATNPPASNPPASNPPASNPPASNPPASNPPASNPPKVSGDGEPNPPAGEPEEDNAPTPPPVIPVNEEGPGDSPVPPPYPPVDDPPPSVAVPEPGTASLLLLGLLALGLRKRRHS